MALQTNVKGLNLRLPDKVKLFFGKIVTAPAFPILQ